MIGAIDLSLLPAPDVVETLDYEVILAEMLADLKARHPDYNNILESDPAYKILEVAAYRELILRQRINDSARSVMIAYAKGADLENLGAFFGITRQVVTAGDPNATPPTPDIYEDDERLRLRITLALDGFSTAGPEGAYIFHALGASGEVKDVSITSPVPGDVVVTVLGHIDNGTPSNELVDSVNTALNHEDVRPLTDNVIVQPVSIIEYQIDANLTFFNGPDMTIVVDEAKRKLEEYVVKNHKLGREITLPAIYAALHQEGVRRIALSQPTADIITATNEAAYCTGINITWGQD